MNWSRSFAVLALLAATPAVAQPYPAEPYYGVVSPRDIMRTVTGMGLQPVSEPRLRGSVWIVRGVGREGTMVRVVLDSHTGRVVDMHAVNRPGSYGPGMQPGPYEPDPRYVMRNQPYGPPGYPAPSPRPGEAYQTQPSYPGPGGAPGGAAMPDDDDFNDGQPGQQPRDYVPPRSSYPTTDKPRVSSKPETKRVAAKPSSVPIPKARPDEIKADVKNDVAKKEDIKKDEAKKEEPKHEQAAVPLTSPKSTEVTGSIPDNEGKPPVAQPKKQELPPVQPLE